MGIFKWVIGLQDRSSVDRRSGRDRRGTYKIKFSDPRKLRQQLDPRGKVEPRRGWRRISRWRSVRTGDNQL